MWCCFHGSPHKREGTTADCPVLVFQRSKQRALARRNIKWLLKRLENHFKSTQICFYSNLGKVFQLPEFQAKLFFKANLSGWFLTRQPLDFSGLFRKRGVRSAECGVRSAECGVRSLKKILKKNKK